MSRHVWTFAVAVGAALATAFWDTGFHVVPAAGGEWRGLTDPPGPGRLVLATLVGTLLALVLARRRGLEWRSLALLGLAAVALIPTATGHAQLGLVFQGPALALMATAVVAWALAQPGAWPRLPEPSPLLLLGVAFVFYATLATRLPGPAGPQGDEPHYLTMAQSLASDGDLDLADEFANREYASFFAGRLQPHTSPASPPGTLYAVHTPGLPALVLPAYMAAGYRGVQWLLSALAALTGLVVFRLVRQTTGSTGCALATWAVLTLTPPLPFYAVAVYPETPAALATALFLYLARGPIASRHALAAAALAACLPWIHPKLLPLAALGSLLVATRARGWRVGSLVLGCLAASVGTLLLYFRATFGEASLAAAYGPGLAGDVSVLRAPWGGAALLFDRQFGLLATGPVWALALPGMVSLLRERRGDAVRALLLGGSSFVVGASFSMWWGGSCPPARFVVPALPALAVALAPALRQRRGLAAALAGLGLAIVASAADAPRVLHNRPNGYSGLARYLAPDLNLDQLAPSFVVENPQAPLLALSLAAAIALTWRFGRKGLLLGGMGYLLMSGGLWNGNLIHTRRATLRLVHAWDPGRILQLAGPAGLDALSIPLDLRRSPWEVHRGVLSSTRRLDLPPGAYRVVADGELSGVDEAVVVARVELTTDTVPLQRHYLRKGRPDSQRWQILLPTGARRVRAEVRGEAGRLRLHGLQLVPEALAPRSQRQGLSWPRAASPERYRLRQGNVRTTARDRSAPDGPGFQLEAGEAELVVDVPAGGTVLCHLRRPRPGIDDTLDWGRRRIELGGAPAELTWPLDPSDGVRLGRHWAVPVRLRSAGAWVAFVPAEPTPRR